MQISVAPQSQFAFTFSVRLNTFSWPPMRYRNSLVITHNLSRQDLNHIQLSLRTQVWHHTAFILLWKKSICHAHLEYTNTIKELTHQKPINYFPTHSARLWHIRWVLENYLLNQSHSCPDTYDKEQLMLLLKPSLLYSLYYRPLNLWEMRCRGKKCDFIPKIHWPRRWHTNVSK